MAEIALSHSTVRYLRRSGPVSPPPVSFCNSSYTTGAQAHSKGQRRHTHRARHTQASSRRHPTTQPTQQTRAPHKDRHVHEADQRHGLYGGIGAQISMRQLTIVLHTSRSAAVRLVSDAHKFALGSAPAVTLCRPSVNQPHTPTAGSKQAATVHANASELQAKIPKNLG